MPSNLRPKDFSRLNRIQKEKGWITYEGSEYVFEKFCQLLENLDEDEKDLILELIERYTWIHVQQYLGRLKKLFDQISQEEIDQLSKIYFFPIVKEEEEDITKSGNSLLYNLKSLKPMLPKFKDIEFKMIEKYNDLESLKVATKNCDYRIFLVDDYMGSGTTFTSVITKVLQVNPTLKPIISILSIVSHRETIKILEDQGFKYYVTLITNKGISDFYDEPELSTNIKIMKGIEKILVSRRHSFGFKKSEDLVTLQRTPNNTFPIFWEKHKIKGETFEAPFSRY